jgi:hypothetical protein
MVSGFKNLFYDKDKEHHRFFTLGMGNVRSYSTAEWNFSNDPEAAHIVLKEMQCPITLVPWETFVRESYQVAAYLFI